MYDFRPITDRITRMRDKVRDRVIIADAAKARLQLEGHQKYFNFPPMLQKPYISLYVISQMPIDIVEDEFFVGDMGCKSWGNAQGDMWVRMDIENIWNFEADGLYHAPDDDPRYAHQKLAISPEDLKELRAIIKEKRSVYGTQKPEEWLPDGARDFFRLQASDYGKIGGFPTMLPPGHLTPGFQHILKRGYADIRRQAQNWLDAHEGNVQGNNMGRYMFYKAATVACDSVTLMTRRYAALCREKALSAAAERRAELENMAEGLDWIAEYPARTFWEALQQVMIYNIFLKVDNDPGVTSLGRFDQYVWPYLKKELDEGTITIERAQELVDAFFLKINTLHGGSFGKLAQTAGIGHIGQHTTICGCVPATGKDATNPVSFMVLETMCRLELHEPTVSCRFSKNTPKEIWDCAVATSIRIGGLPLLQNDEVIIPALIKELNFSLEDARDFAFIGCQEITGSGNDYPAPNGSAMSHNGIYWAIALLMAINNGVNPMNGERAPEKVCSGYLTDMDTMDDVRAAFEKMANWLLTWSATLSNYTEHEYPRLFPFPNLSISIDGCMESGKDVSEGGAKYNSYGGTATGLATTADSLTALKYMVFDNGLVSKKEMLDAVLANWDGYEALRQRVINEVPHYGNGDPYADAEMKYVIDLYYNLTRSYSTHRCTTYKCGTFGASDHIAQGEITWATPDGRKTGTPIADASSPVQGRDVNGITAVFRSSTNFDHSHFMDGMALNLKIHPSALNSVDGITKLESATQTYFDLGGMEVQYNVVDAETLKKAQEEPNMYHNLVVRIAGFSAYFVDMTPAMQNDIISRAEHSI